MIWNMPDQLKLRQMKSIAITNVDDLRSEINRLMISEDEQRVALGHRFSSPSALLASALTLFPKSTAAKSVMERGMFHQDFVSLISRFVIPLTLNKTLFRSSGFLVKLMVGLVSQKVSGYITGSAVEKLIKQGKDVISNVLTKRSLRRMSVQYIKQ